MFRKFNAPTIFMHLMSFIIDDEIEAELGIKATTSLDVYCKYVLREKGMDDLMKFWIAMGKYNDDEENEEEHTYGDAYAAEGDYNPYAAENASSGFTDNSFEAYVDGQNKDENEYDDESAQDFKNEI